MSVCIECSLNSLISFGVGVLMTAQVMHLAVEIAPEPQPERSPTAIVASAAPENPYVMELQGPWPPRGPDGAPVPDAGSRPTLTVNAVCPPPAPSSPAAGQGPRDGALRPVSAPGSDFDAASLFPSPGKGLASPERSQNALSEVQGRARALDVATGRIPALRLLDTPDVVPVGTPPEIVALPGPPISVAEVLPPDSPPVPLPASVGMFISALAVGAWLSQRKNRQPL